MTYVPIERGTYVDTWDVPVNAAFTDQDARITTNTNSIASNSSAITTNLDNLVFNVRNHGAVGDGVTNDAPAINALIDSLEASAVHGTIYFPRGTYLISSPLTPTKALRYTGDQGATIKSSNNDIFDFAGNYMHPGFSGQVGVLEIDHLTLDATGGHVFTNAVINQGSFHDLNLIQRSSNKGIWFSNSTLLVINFRDIISTVYGATRSVPAWSITGVSTADVANLTWSNCLFQNPDADATQYQVLLQATDGTAARRYHEQCAFINCYFEMPYGGAIKSLSGEGTLFQNCRVYDVFTNTVGNSLFYLGSGASSTWPSTNTTFIGCGRDLQGPNGSSTWDIQMESATVQTTIQNYSVRDIPSVFDGHPFFNLGNSNAIVLINNDQQTLTNSATATNLVNIVDGAITLTGKLNLAQAQQVNVGGSGSGASYAALRSATTDFFSSSRVTGDGGNRITVQADGLMAWGNGVGATDTVLKRNGAGSLRTDTFFSMASGQSDGGFSVFGNTATAINIGSAGGGLSVKAGTNAKAGTVTANGTTAVTVTTTAITANSVVCFGLKTQAGTAATGAPFMSAVTAGTSFQIKSSAGDTSVYNWIIFDLTP